MPFTCFVFRAVILRFDDCPNPYRTLRTKEFVRPPDVDPKHILKDSAQNRGRRESRSMTAAKKFLHASRIKQTESLEKLLSRSELEILHFILPKQH